MNRFPRSKATVELVPFPVVWLPEAWRWLNEDRDANFDDSGPMTAAHFTRELRLRLEREQVYGVTADGRAVGFFGYQPITPRLGTFHGICFTRRVCGTGIPADAIGQFLEARFANGVEKICASFFADNLRVARFFQKLGAVSEGLHRKHTVRHGVPIDVALVAIFAEGV